MSASANRRILVADDDPSTRFTLEYLLRTWGYETILVENGDKAWEILSAESPPSFVILDWIMPGLDGLEICRRLRDSKEFIYILMLTSRSGTDDIVVGLDAGANDYLVKPVVPAELRSRIAVGMRTIEYEFRLRQYAEEMESLAEARAQQLIHAERLATLGTLAASIAHEINNPLLYVSGNIQNLELFWKHIEPKLRSLLAVEKDDRHLAFALEEMPIMLGDIRHGLDRITAIVQGLRRFSRKDEDATRPSELRLLIQNALTICGPKLKHVKVEMQIPEALPLLHVRPQQIEQVLVNLIMNAADAMGEKGGVLRLLAEATSESIRIAVEDTGPGIDPKVLPHLFLPFTTTKPVGEGTGLGLSISRGIIEEHGGSIRGENTASGARFVITLPVGTNHSPQTNRARNANPS